MGTALGDFIRAKRDATLPGDLGLPDNGRRRAPGLRRIELAMRAGISVEYLTRIEQGRDHHPTVSVLNAIADGLGLNVEERRHLAYLAKIASGVCVTHRVETPRPARQEPRPSAVGMLRLLEPDGVAMVTNKLGDVLAHTSAFERLMGSSGLLASDEPNLTRYVFTDARARRFLGNWGQVADVQAFDLWHVGTLMAWEGLTKELESAAGEDFTARISKKLPPNPEPWHIVSADGTPTRWQREVLEIPAAPEQQIVIFMPADPETRAAFDRARHENVTPLRVAR